MSKSDFTKPKLCKAKQGWYVYIREIHKDPNKKRRKKVFKLGLNLEKDLKEREFEANALISAISYKVKNNFNFFNDNMLPDKMFFGKALEFSLSKLKSSISKKTYSGYKGSINRIIIAAKELDLDKLEIDSVKRNHIRIVMEKAKELYNWTNNSYNKNLSYLSAVMTELIEWDMIEYNAATKIKRLKVAESNKNRTATKEEHKIIKNHLRLNYPDFCNYIEAEYYTGARPFELLEIKISMIDLRNRIITLPPISTKTGIKHRKIIIDNGFLSILLNMQIERYPKDFYLFGSYRQKGKGNIGKHLDFICGTTKIKRDTATKRWKRIVKDELNINVNMYSYKHKGADDKLKAGVDLDSIRNQLGHSTKKMTTVYAKEITGVYKKDIIDNSTEF